MKLYILINIAILLFISNQVYTLEFVKRGKLRLNKRVHIQQKDNQIDTTLPTTPKGQDLANVYGLPPDNQNYGVHPVIPGKTQFTILQADGKTKNLLVDNKDLNNIQSTQCRISQDPHYQLCQNLNDCDLCSNSDVCGWCAASNQCLPGNLNGAKCPGDCLNHWLFEKGNCTGKVRSGSLGNIAVDATKLVTPEYTEPKVKVNTYTTEHVTVNKQIQVGQQNVTQVIKEVSSNGTIISKLDTKSVPIMGNLQRQVPLNTKIESATYSLSSGKKLDQDQNQQAKFGTQ